MFEKSFYFFGKIVFEVDKVTKCVTIEYSFNEIFWLSLQWLGRKDSPDYLTNSRLSPEALQASLSICWTKERKPGFRLSAKKPPDQIRRPEDYSLQHYRETPSGILQLCVGPSHTREDPRDRDGPEKSSSLCEKELQKHIQRWRYAQWSQLADPRNQKEEPETHHDVQDTQQPGWNWQRQFPWGEEADTA